MRIHGSKQTSNQRKLVSESEWKRERIYRSNGLFGSSDGERERETDRERGGDLNSWRIGYIYREREREEGEAIKIYILFWFSNF